MNILKIKKKKFNYGFDLFFMLFVYCIKILNCNKCLKRKFDLYKFFCNVDVFEFDYK